MDKPVPASALLSVQNLRVAYPGRDAALTEVVRGVSFELGRERLGGMGQRVMIAMMLIAGPEFLIADEPTSALDVSVQLQVLSILDKLVAERGMGLIFISHDLRLVYSFCDRVLVMYAGRVVEELSSSRLHEAEHPYTRGLLACLPVLGEPRHPLPTLQRQAEWAL